MDKKVLAIVVTYNRSAMLKECIERLQSSAYPVDILVVNNHSEDETEEILKQYSEEGVLHFCDTGKNIGGAGGFSYGLQKAWEGDYDYYWLMDDDTMVHSDSLAKLMDSAEILQDDFGFLSSVALWTDGKICKMNYHEVAINWNEEKQRLFEGLLQVQTATFVSFLVRPKVVEEMGLPLKEYFIWGDDTEYSMRLSKKYKNYLCFQSKVTHKMVKNEGTGEFWEIQDPKRLDRMKNSIRNDMCTYRRHSKTLWILNTVKLWKDFFKVLRMPCTNKGKKMAAILSGMWKGTFFSPKVEYLPKK